MRGQRPVRRVGLRAVAPSRDRGRKQHDKHEKREKREGAQQVKNMPKIANPRCPSVDLPRYTFADCAKVLEFPD